MNERMLPAELPEYQRQETALAQLDQRFTDLVARGEIDSKAITEDESDRLLKNLFSNNSILTREALDNRALVVTQEQLKRLHAEISYSLNVYYIGPDWQTEFLDYGETGVYIDSLKQEYTIIFPQDLAPDTEAAMAMWLNEKFPKRHDNDQEIVAKVFDGEISDEPGTEARERHLLLEAVLEGKIGPNASHQDLS